ncbi:MAG: TonB-dependent receptor [Massilia sp.]|nr:TonB-dependent receptor [Massilia sp.]MDB5951780.1 TonB-dependent receptor [Massilia sp.]
MSLHLPAVCRGYVRATCRSPRPHAGSWARPAWFSAGLLCLIPAVAHAAATDNNRLNLSFAELANIEITSVSKRTERLAAAAASVFVITRDDLRRSGVASLPEALRMAPNLHVTATSGNDYAISAGANRAGHWERQLDSGARLSWQAYFDRTQRDVVPPFAESLDIVDTQLQYTMAPIGTHILTWGANHRVRMDHLVNGQYIAFLPAEIKQKWSSLFIQDEVSPRDNLRLTLGARVERNDYSGREFLPNARLGWKVAPEQFLWSAVSRSVRAPSRFDRDVYVPAVPPFLLDGGAPVRSELATVHELGYRGQPASTLSYSVTAYHTVYDFLRTQEIAPDRRSMFFGRMMEGKASGVAMWATYQATPSWRLNAGFSAPRERLTVKPGSTDADSAGSSGADPARKLTLRSPLDVSPQTQLDFTVRRLAALPLPEVPPAEVPAYTALDVRLGWRPDPYWEVSLGGQKPGRWRTRGIHFGDNPRRI